MSKLRPDRKADRQEEAKARNKAWAALSPEKQLASLDARGMVAKKQRDKITKKVGG